MIVICAWCQTLIRMKCPHCGETLVQPDEPELIGQYMKCPTGPTAVLHSIDNMKTTHGMCEPCTVAFQEEAKTRRENAANEEQQTKPEPEKKRGPTHHLAVAR